MVSAPNPPASAGRGRRFEKKGLVYVRGYKSEDRQTPFREGYLIAWMRLGTLLSMDPTQQMLGVYGLKNLIY